MPSFLNWPVAAAAAAIVIPSLLVLYFLKLRRKEADVPSTLLWRKSIQDLQVNAPFQKLRKNLLLLLQMLLLLLLLLALSRPIMNYTPGAGAVSVIAIDRSASMTANDIEGGKTRLAEAKRLAGELVDSMGKNAQAMVIAFDDNAEIVQAFTTNRTLLRQAIERIQPTDRRSALATAFTLAEAQAQAFRSDASGGTDMRPELWVYSDGRVRDARELTLKLAELKYTKIGSDTAPNVAIVALNAKRNFERPTEVQVFARLANFGPDPAQVVVQLSHNGQVMPRGIKRVDLLPERWDQARRDQMAKDKGLVSQEGVEFNLELTDRAVISLELKENSKDTLRADDSAHIVVPPPRSLNVMMVSEGHWWLERFLDSANLKKPQTITPEAYKQRIKDPQALASQVDVIIFDRYSPEALPPAGNFIFNNAVPPKTKLAVAKDAGGVNLKFDRQLVLDWDRNHPLMRYLNMRFLAQNGVKLDVPPEAQVIIEGTSGPLVVLYREARNTHLIFSFDIGDSSFPTSPAFPAFMNNAMQYLALGSDMDVRASYQPGDSPRIPRYNLVQGNVREVIVTKPGGERLPPIPVPEVGDFALPALERVGVYELSPPVPQFDRIAVNLLDDNESNLLPVDRPPGGTGTAIAATAGKSRLDLWWWIVAFAAIPLCLIEWWVYTRRVHL